MIQRIPAWLLGAVLGTGAFWYGKGCYEHNLGLRDAAIRAMAHQIDSLRHRAARVDTVYTRDTIRLTRWRTTYDTTRDTVLQQLTDTVRVKEFVHIADSTIQACSAVVLTCTQRVAQRDSILALQAAQITALRHRGKLFGILPPPPRGIVFSAGLLAGALLTR